MGKRSDFERVPRDFYPTPESAVLPLLPHLLPGTRYIEPCAGALDLVRHLKAGGLHCVGAYDIEFGGGWGSGTDATTAKYPDDIASFFITNPPWSRDVLHPIIANLSAQLPTWLLFDADWMHTKQAAPYLPWLRAIVSVGRVKWIPDSPFTGKDNCCWYLFNQHSDSLDDPALFYGRAA